MADNKNLRVKRVRIADGVRDVPLGQAVWENPGPVSDHLSGSDKQTTTTATKESVSNLMAKHTKQRE